MGLSAIGHAQWAEFDLPNGRSEICTISLNGDIYFIGGALSGVTRYGQMDIYNVDTETWSAIDLPNPTKGNTCVAIDEKLYIGVWSQRIIDIYDINNSTWSELTTPLRVDELIQLDSFLIISNAGDIALYNLNSEEWTEFDGPWRSENAIAATQGKIITAGGGGTSDVRIYDIATDSWTTASLSIARDELLGVSYGSKVFFIGGEADGFNWVDRIDIYDVASNTWTIDSLSRGRLRFDVTVYQDKLFVAGGQIISFSNQFRPEIDILDLRTNIWETILMPTGRSYPSVVGHEDKLYIAGGNNDDQDNLSIVESYHLETSTNTTSILDESVVSIYPNPVSSLLNIAVDDAPIERVTIVNVNGRIISDLVSPGTTIDVSTLDAGTYLLSVYMEDSIVTTQFFKVE